MKYLLFISVLVLVGCNPTQKLQRADKRAKASLQALVVDSKRFKENFTGFVLYDPKEDRTLFDQYGDKYFTPASNTKIFTFYACLKILGDSIPALKYAVTGDSLIFWGTGDPSFLNPKVKNGRTLKFLKNRDEKLFYAPQYLSSHFGPGWAWDDYNGAYSPEKCAFPIYGNMIQFRKRKDQTEGTTIPVYFKRHLKKSNGRSNHVQRNIHNNDITYSYRGVGSAYSKNIPFRFSNQLLLKLLKEATGKEVQSYWKLSKIKNKGKTFYSVATDDVLKKMMQPSDNFLAEQLLLVCASVLNRPLSSRGTIKYVVENFLKDLPDHPQWRDGSGLSRYNLFTPRSVVVLLKKIQQEYGLERVLPLFPAGGQSGTIRKWYKGDPPYVFAKTGTLSNNHCLSGYLKTKSGRILIFSFMNNHYLGSSTPYKREMEKVLRYIYESY